MPKEQLLFLFSKNDPDQGEGDLPLKTEDEYEAGHHPQKLVHLAVYVRTVNFLTLFDKDVLKESV